MYTYLPLSVLIIVELSLKLWLSSTVKTGVKTKYFKTEVSVFNSYHYLVF